MRLWLTALPREARWVVIAAGSVFLLAITLLVLNVATVSFEGLADISSQKPRIARLNGYVAVSQDLKTQSDMFSVGVSRLSYSDSGDADQVGASLQQTLRGFAEESGLVVTGSQLAVVAPDDSEEEAEDAGSQFEEITVRLTVDGPPLAVDAFLLAVSQHSPALSTRSLEVQRKRRSRGDDRDTSEWLTVQLRVVALRLVT